MSKWKRTSLICWAILIGLPTGLYLFVNFYWWLFDGNVLNGIKMEIAFWVFIVSLIAEVIALTFPGEL